MNRFQYFFGLLIVSSSVTFGMEAHTPLKQFLEKHVEDPRCRACLTGVYYQTKINALQTSIQKDGQESRDALNNRIRIKNGFVNSYTGMIRETKKACDCPLNAD